MLPRAARRNAILEEIADKNDKQRDLEVPSQAQLDDWWDEPERWGKDAPAGKVGDKAERRYHGQRSNEDKAAIVRRAVARLVVPMPRKLSNSALAVHAHKKLRLPRGIPVPGERALRRIIAENLDGWIRLAEQRK